MEVENSRAVKRLVAFDEVSMERSKSFVTALQELKNLRPQLYSAAEYCEKSYLNSEQKQMVFDNLKGYVVQALVNAVDHLGTVAFKFSDILEQQTPIISSMDLKVTCLNQRLRTYQTCMDTEGLRQHQVSAIIPRHHKHYILPNSVNKKVHFSPLTRMDSRQQARARLYSSGASPANTLSWHLASETKSTLKGSPRDIMSIGGLKTNEKPAGAFTLLDADDNTRIKSTQASSVTMQTLGVKRRDFLDGSKPSTPYRFFDNSTQRAITRPPVRRKSMLSAFFVKQKTPKLRTNA